MPPALARFAPILKASGESNGTKIVLPGQQTFMAELAGNLLVAQSGGPTAVINASLAGVIQEAGRNDCIEEIYGGLNGILGMLNEELIDINDEKRSTIEGLKH